MRTFYSSLISIFTFFSTLSLGQPEGTILFEEDFDNIPGSTAGGPGTYVFPSGWHLQDIDQRTPLSDVNFVNAAWERREDYRFNVNDTAAFSTSAYIPSGQANDWMISPAIVLGPYTRLKWKAIAYNPELRDGYEVRISTTAQLRSECLANLPLLVVDQEDSVWTERYVDLDSAGYANDTVYIAWANVSDNKNLLLIDDIVVEVSEGDIAQLDSLHFPSEYTIIPLSQQIPLRLGAVVRNNRPSAPVTGVRVKADIYENDILVNTKVSDITASIPAGSEEEFLLPPYVPADTGIVEIEYTIMLNEADEDMSNNIRSVMVYISENELARDDGQCIRGFGIGTMDKGEIGSSYILNKPVNLSQVKIYLQKNDPGRPVYGNIRDFENGRPDRVLAVTDTFTAADTAGSWITLNILNGPVYLPADTFFIAVVEEDTLTIGQTQDIFTRKANWFRWPASFAGPGWQSPESYSYLYETAFMIRSVVETVPPKLIYVDCKKDSFYSTLTGPDDGYLQVRSYAYNDVGRPADDNDLSANVWMAWDSTWFYFYEEVKDDTIAGNSSTYWQQDGLHLNIDPQPSLYLNSKKLCLTPDGIPNFVYGDSLNIIADSNKQWLRKKVSGGYIQEFAVKWDAICFTTEGYEEYMSPVVDSVFGFSLVQYDNDGRGYSHAGIAWAADMSHTLINGISKLGRVRFLEGNKLKFLPFNMTTGDTNYIPYDGRDITEPPVIVDSFKDEFYNALSGPDDGYLQIRSYAFNDMGMPENDNDLSVKVWTAWDDNWFYLYEEVLDDTIAGNSDIYWHQDHLDMNIDPVPGINLNSMKISLSPEGPPDFNYEDTIDELPDSCKQWVRRNVPGGYVIELALRWSFFRYTGDFSEEITPAADSVFGFSLVQYDNDGRGYCHAAVAWAAGMSHTLINGTGKLGRVQFLENNKLRFLPFNIFTGDTNSIPYDGSDYVRVGVDEDEILPSQFSLSQNYPNPFNPSTVINFAIPKSSFVDFRVYDILGNEVKVLLNEEREAGEYKIKIDAGYLSSGVYFYQLRAGSFVQTNKMILLK